MKKYLVSIEYTDYDEIEVEAKNKKQAEQKALAELDFVGNVTNITVEELNEEE